MCDFCKSECQEVQGIEVAKAVGLLMIDAEEICAVNLWHKELLQILNHVSDIRVSATNAQKVIDEMNDGKVFPVKMKCAWSSFNGVKNLKKIFSLF